MHNINYYLKEIFLHCFVKYVLESSYMGQGTLHFMIASHTQPGKEKYERFMLGIVQLHYTTEGTIIILTPMYVNRTSVLFQGSMLSHCNNIG